MLSPPVRRILFFLPLLGLGTEALLHFIQVVAGRIRYPYELEWMEGAMLHQVLQLLQGAPLYGDPTPDFMPALYMPLYYSVSSLSVLLLGESLFALRVVSVLATVVTFGLLFVIARRVSGSWCAALLAMLLFAWIYPHNAFWFDLARLDSLWTMALVFTVYALLRLRDAPSVSAVSFVAVCFLIAFLTKQASLFLLPFITLALLCWSGWRYTLQFCVICGAMLLLSLIVLQLTTGGRFWFFTFEMASTHGVTVAGFRRFGLDILFSIPLLVLLAAIFPLLQPVAWRQRVGWLLILIGFVFLSMLSRAYAGAFFNVLMPLHACVALLAALGFSFLVERLRLALLPVLLLLLVLGGLSWEMYRGRYEPKDQLPTQASLAAHQQLVARLSAVDGKVCVASHGYLGWLAGKSFCAHNTQLTDILTGSDPAIVQSVREAFRQRILSGDYAVLVLDREKELKDLGLNWQDIPYTVTKIEYPQGPLRFPVNGYSPQYWLEFSGPLQEKR
jgi:4-amino-4-deoxy-L-arabinose transferase-like glycosyltransferase